LLTQVAPRPSGKERRPEVAMLVHRDARPRDVITEMWYQ
jgi:hypothetical protein